MLSDRFYHLYLQSLRKLSNLSILISISSSALTLSFVYGHVIFYFMLINSVYLHLLIVVAKIKKNLDAWRVSNKKQNKQHETDTKTMGKNGAPRS